MENKLKIVVALIVMSVHFASASFAQSNPIGYGMYTTTVQYTKSIDSVEYFSTNALFGTTAQINRIYRNVLHPVTEKIIIPRSEVITITENEMSAQMGEEFHPEHPEWYSVAYEEVDGDFWDEWEDSYLILADRKLHWGDPRLFALNRNYPDKKYLIETVTRKTTGHFFKRRANCGNVLRPLHKQVQVQRQVPAVYEQPVPPVEYASRETVPVSRVAISQGCRILSFTSAPADDASGPGQASVLNWSTTCSTVNIAGVGTALQGTGQYIVHPMHTTTYRLTCDGGYADVTVVVLNLRPEPRKGWFAKNAGWVIPLGVAVIGGAIYLGSHHGTGNSSGSYSNAIPDIHGGTTPSGVPPDGGGSPHTY